MVEKTDDAEWHICVDCGNVYHETERESMRGLRDCSCGCSEFSREKGYSCSVCGISYSAYDDARICEQEHG